jgi:hypothetical protein
MNDELVVTCLRSRIASNEHNFETWNPDTVKLPHMIPMAYTQRGMCLFDNAVFHHMLGENGIARELFARAADFLKEGALRFEPPKLSTMTSALEAALLAHDWEAAHQISNSFSKCSNDRLVKDRLAYSLALPLLVLKSDAEVEVLVNEAMEMDPRKAWYPGIGKLLALTLTRDTSGFVSTAEGVLDIHHRRARQKKSHIYSSSVAFVCVPITVLGIIAISRGMDVFDRITNRHDTIPMSLAYISDYKGEPIPKGATVDVQVDYVPRELLITGHEKG